MQFFLRYDKLFCSQPHLGFCASLFLSVSEMTLGNMLGSVVLLVSLLLVKSDIAVVPLLFLRVLDSEVCTINFNKIQGSVDCCIHLGIC